MEPDGVAAAAEMEDLVGHCLELAERLLNKHGGEFREFAGCVDAAGVTSTAWTSARASRTRSGWPTSLAPYGGRRSGVRSGPPRSASG